MWILGVVVVVVIALCVIAIFLPQGAARLPPFLTSAGAEGSTPLEAPPTFRTTRGSHPTSRSCSERRGSGRASDIACLTI
jgi:hypothetical protein